jgi:hypothetical protein
VLNSSSSVRIPGITTLNHQSLPGSSFNRARIYFQARLSLIPIKHTLFNCSGCPGLVTFTHDPNHAPYLIYHNFDGIPYVRHRHCIHSLSFGICLSDFVRGRFSYPCPGFVQDHRSLASYRLGASHRSVIRQSLPSVLFSY